MQRGYEGGGSIAEGVTFKAGWTFYHQWLPVHANGQVATQDEVFAAPPGGQFCLACRPRHHWLTVFIPTTLLFPSPQGLEFTERAKPFLLKPPSEVTRRFARLGHRFLSAVERKPQLMECPAALEAYQRDLIRAAQNLFLKSPPSTSPHFARWHGMCRSTLELAERHHDQSVLLPQIAQQIGVPERTLRSAFQNCYGLSPIEYLRMQRLAKARVRLLESSPDETTVSEIAFDLGFWDLGRFAGAYRMLYRELPSQTLRRKHSS